MSFSASLPKAALDQLKGFITLCKAKPEVQSFTCIYSSTCMCDHNHTCT